MKENIQVFLKKYLNIIIRILFVILWIIFYFLNWITLQRIIAFFLILSYIYIYKKCIEIIKDFRPIKNLNILLFLINVDKLKLIIINIIINLYIFIFNLKEVWRNNKIIKIMEWIIKLIIINPLLLIIHKFYYLLYIWISKSYKEIIFTRFYGMILAVLIFSPIYNNIYILLNKNWFYIYLLIIIISILDDIKDNLDKEEIEKYKYIKYMYSIIGLLKINKDIKWILEYRNKISTFAILLRNSIKDIKDRNSSINKYAFEINVIYINILVEGTLECKEIIDYDTFLKNSILILMKKSLIKNYNSLFRTYFINLYTNLNQNLYEISSIICYKLQRNIKISEKTLIKLNKLENMLYNLIKLLLFYLFNISKLMGFNEFYILKEFQIKYELGHYQLNYNISRFWSYEELEEIDKIIKNKHFYLYKEFYEQMYLYTNIVDFDVFENLGINNKKYKYINEFIDIYINYKNITTTEEWGLIKALRLRYEMEEPIYIELEKFRNKLVKEWKIQSKDLTILNFYEKCYSNLEELNNYVRKEIEESKNN